MSQTLFFYDLETSGFNPKEARIMQFAGQRTDLNLQVVGKPVNQLIKLTPDVIPEPGAILLTGITPQETIKKGLTEAEFLKQFYTEIALPGTIFVGFNSVRFDDEFIRYLNYRNFYDPYEWQWSNNRSRWDMFDVIRMTRALRPDGINWPKDESGKPVNRLVDLASANGIKHSSAHDALSDVEAVIGLAKLVFKNQPKLFNYLLSVMRDKAKVAHLVHEDKPFIYTSGRFSSEFEKTAAVGLLGDHPSRQGALVFDLRYDPKQYADMSIDELYEAWIPTEDKQPLPIKTLMFNRCPAIAPISVFDKNSEKRLKLSLDLINEHYQNLEFVKEELLNKLNKAIELLDSKREIRSIRKDYGVDGELYNGFFSSSDRRKIITVSGIEGKEVKSLKPDFEDPRLNKLLPLYKARNFPELLSENEQEEWLEFRKKKFQTNKESINLYKQTLGELLKDSSLNKNQLNTLNQLKTYLKTVGISI